MKAFIWKPAFDWLLSLQATDEGVGYDRTTMQWFIWKHL
jgi:hypothetical protein